MRILVACEMSGVVRDAFIAMGHDAISCDLLPSMRPGPHIQGDVLGLLGMGWDMMIAFPPCTDLAVSGARYFAQKRADGRQQRSIDFFLSLASAPIPKIAIENPVGIMSSMWRKPDQIVQPWMFGHPESKATCLWLKGLPKLKPTVELVKPSCGYWSNPTPSGQNKLGPSADRARIRGITYKGIADTMAAQWGHA